MEAVNTLKGYGKVVDAAEENLRRRRRRRLAVASAVLLLAFVIAAVACIATLVHSRSGSPAAGESSSPPVVGEPSSPTNSLSIACRFASDFKSCFSILSAAGANSSTDPEKILQISLRVSADEITRISGAPDAIAKGINDVRAVGALNDCKELLSEATDSLNASMALLNRKISPGEKILTPSKIEDLRTWLSAALTDQDTCLDSFEGVEGGFREKMDLTMRNATIYIKNSLAIASHIDEIVQHLRVPIHRKLLSHA